MDYLQQSFYVKDDEEWSRSQSDNVVVLNGARLQTVAQVHFFQEKQLPTSTEGTMIYVDHCQLFMMGEQLQVFEWHHELYDVQPLPWSSTTIQRFVVMDEMLFVHHRDQSLVSYYRHSHQVLRQYRWPNERILHSQVVETGLVVWTIHESIVTMRLISTSCTEQVLWRLDIVRLHRTIYCSAYVDDGVVVGAIYVPQQHQLYDSLGSKRHFSTDVQAVTVLSDRQWLTVSQRERQSFVQLHEQGHIPEVVYRSSSRHVIIQRHLAYTFIIDEPLRKVLGGTWQQVTRRTVEGARGSIKLGPFDCYNEGHQWQQLKWGGHIPEMCHVKVTCWAGDDEQLQQAVSTVFHDGTVYDLAALKGRYFAVQFDLQGTRTATPHLQYVQLTYEKRDLFVHLPAFFREDVLRSQFLPRFLSLMQSFIDDIDETVDAQRRMLHEQLQLWQQLGWRKEWFARDNQQHVANVLAELIWRRGTRTALQVAVQLYVEHPPLIIEMRPFKQIEQAEVNRSMWTSLLGTDERVTWLFIDVDEAQLYDVRQTIRAVIEPFIPSYTNVQIVFLERAIRLDQHCYLGVNSYLTAYYPLQLVAHATLPSYGQLPHEGQETILNDDSPLGPSFTLV